MNDDDPPPPPPPSGDEEGGAVPAKKLCERCKKNKAIAKIAVPGEPPESKIKACQACIDEIASGIQARLDAEARHEGTTIEPHQWGKKKKKKKK
jgi:hypothetical protein